MCNELTAVKRRLIVSIVILGLLSLCGPAEARDFTFFVWSDSHFGAYDFSDTTRLKIIERMNDLPGKAYPPEVFKDTRVDKPSFVLHLGDITEHGRQSEWNDPNIADQRSYLQTVRHLQCTDKVYEVIGNHDSRTGNNIRAFFAERHKAMYYSFDVQGVHLVVLDAYRYNNTAAPDIDERQFEWLEKDLARLKGDTPVIIAMHVQPNSRLEVDGTSKPSDKTSDRLWQIIAEKNIVAFLHGHWHIVRHTRWLEYDVLAPAGFAYMRSGCPRGQPIFAVVRITDTEMTVLSYDWHTGSFLSEPSLRKSVAED